MTYRYTLVSLGEALFDLFPGARRLGGAPLNVAVHLQRLIEPHQGRSVLVTRVGQDSAGAELVAQLRERGVATDWIQTDPDRATGQVRVSFAADGEPSYDIRRNVAWDALQFDPDLEDLAREADGVCFGTLAQRYAQTRNTIHRFLEVCPQAVRMLDVNLRQDFYDRDILHRSLAAATLVKLNEAELAVVCDLLAVDAGEGEDRRERELIARYGFEAVVLTRGERGTRIITADDAYEGEPDASLQDSLSVGVEPVEFSPPTPTLSESASQASGMSGASSQEPPDPVGAGDAAAAAVLAARVLGLAWQRAATAANRAGAFVAARAGATPELPTELLSP